MKIRYCETPLQQLNPCLVATAGSGGAEDCHDHPMKEHCNNIVDTNNLRCPYCGQKIKMPKKE